MSESLLEVLECHGVSVDCPSEDAQAEAMTLVARLEYAGERYVLCSERPPPTERPRFSARELEIARLISRGHTTRTVAAVLEISPWTVNTYVRRMFAKLDVPSRSALIAQLALLGLLGLEES